MLLEEESQEVSKLPSWTHNGVDTEKTTQENAQESEKDDQDNAPDWMSDILSAPDTSLVNSTTNDFR